MNIEEEFTCITKKKEITVHRRVEETKPSPLSNQSIYSSITQNYVPNNKNRLMTTIKEGMAFGYSDNSLNTCSSSVPSTRKYTTPSPTPINKPVEKPVEKSAISIPPPPIVSSKPPPPSTPPPVSSSVSKPPPPSTPPPIFSSSSSSSILYQPPPNFLSENLQVDYLSRSDTTPHQEPSSFSVELPHTLPSDFLTEIQQKGSQHQAAVLSQSTPKPTPSSSTPKPTALPANFLAEIRQKGQERQQSISSSSKPSPSPSQTPVQKPPALPSDFLAEIRQKGSEHQAAVLSQSTSDNHPSSSSPKPPALPANFLSEIQQKGSEHQAAVLSQSTPKPTPSSSTPKPPALPANFLAEIRQKGQERQEASLHRTTQESIPQVSKRNTENRSYQSSLSSRNGTIRTGTLGGKSRASNRYGTLVLNDLRGLDRNFYAEDSGEASVSTSTRPSMNSVLDEIRSFDIKRLRKVNRDENTPPLNSSTNSQSNESSMAAMLRERLHIMQSDSSDEFDSSSDFSI